MVIFLALLVFAPVDYLEPFHDLRDGGWTVRSAVNNNENNLPELHLHKGEIHKKGYASPYTSRFSGFRWSGVFGDLWFITTLDYSMQ